MSEDVNPTGGTPPSSPAGPSTPAAPDAGGAPPPSGEGAPSAADTASGATPTDPAPATDSADADPDEAHWKWLENTDPDEVIKRNRRVAGKIGDYAQRLRQREKVEEEKRQAEDRKQQQAEDDRRRQDEIDELIDRDPDAALTKLKTLRDDQKKREAEEAEATKAHTEQVQQYAFTDAFLHNLFFKLPIETQRKLANKAYTGKTPAEARDLYFQDIVEHLAEHKATAKLAGELTKAKGDWENDLKTTRLPAYRRDVLAEVNAADPQADVGTGGVGGKRQITPENFREFIKNDELRHQYRDEIDAYLADRYKARTGKAP